MRRRRLIAALSGLSLLIAAPGAPAQRLAPRAVATHHTVVPLPAELDSAARAPGSRWENTARGALIGAGAGTMLGVAVATFGAASASNHSEDGVIFTYLGVLGAVAGLVIGSAVGALTPP